MIQSPPLISEEPFYKTLLLPRHKPPLFKLGKFTLNAVVDNYQLINTPKGLSYSGDCMTGLTLLILISLTEEVTYIACNTEQTLHAIHYGFSKTLRLHLPETYNGQPTNQLIESEHFTLFPSVQLLYSNIIDSYSFEQLTSVKVEFKPYLFLRKEV